MTDDAVIDVWCSFEAAVPEEALVAYDALLDPAERQRERRFYFARDRRRYRVTRALVRTVLSRYVPIEPEQWVFAANGHGKPEIAIDMAAAGRLTFNVTHTDGLIVLAVGCGGALGVDAENVRSRRAPLEVANAFFAPDEVAALFQLPASERPQRFFEYWTLKESYVKARGLGLAIPLDRFAFHLLRDQAIALVVDPEEDEAPQRWRFWQFRAGPDHLAALCAERVSPALRLRIRQIVPLVSESALPFAPLRSSDGWITAPLLRPAPTASIEWAS